jgi:hypothetical protein
MKKIYFLMLFLFSVSIFSQSNNPISPKYIIVKSTFNFLKQVDRYRTSSFTKFLFEKEGFKVYLDNEQLPEELYYNKCKAMFVDIKDDSNLFYTKNFIELLDCNNNLIHTSQIGKSKLKDYEKTYRQSIRNAFSTFKNLDSIYTSFSSVKITKSTKKESNLEIVAKTKETKQEIIKPAVNSSTSEKKNNLIYSSLIAKDISSGYQLLNRKNQVIFIILKTGNQNRFIIKNKNGSLINKGSYWLAEYYEDQKLITKKIKINF